jgi:TnpA family transposase
MLSFVNRRNMRLDKLEAAQCQLIELYLRLDLPKHLGDDKTVAADSTQCDFYDNNLLAGYHFRYRTRGAVAYRHVRQTTSRCFTTSFRRACGKRSM